MAQRAERELRPLSLWMPTGHHTPRGDPDGPADGASPPDPLYGYGAWGLGDGNDDGNGETRLPLVERAPLGGTRRRCRPNGASPPDPLSLTRPNGGRDGRRGSTSTTTSVPPDVRLKVLTVIQPAPAGLQARMVRDGTIAGNHSTVRGRRAPRDTPSSVGC